MRVWRVSWLHSRPSVLSAPWTAYSKPSNTAPSARSSSHSSRKNRKKRLRTYSEALELLSQLQSNRSTTALFDRSASPSSTPGARDAKELNAAAIPEMLTWLRRAGYKQQDLAQLRHIHVAGTKGKGSVCAYATAMLMKYGTVGTYTSPHLVSPRERIAIDGQPLTPGAFARYFFELWDKFTAAAKRDGKTEQEAEGPESKPFYFRYLTLLAWHAFLKKGVESVVMECGIGGEFDATNIVPVGAVSTAVVTQLGIDHVAMLGDTVEDIAWHKAGIFKPGARAFTRQLSDQPTVMEVLRSRATQKGTGLIEVQDSLVESWGGVKGNIGGDHQKFNQALAVLAVMHHQGMESDPASALRRIPREMVQGLREASLRGRGEVFEDGGAVWLLDGAHNKDSLEQVARWLAKMLSSDENVVLVFNQQERDAVQLLSHLILCVERETRRDDMFSHALFSRNEVQTVEEKETRDLSVQRDAAAAMTDLSPNCQTQVFDSVEHTFTEARRLATESGTKQKILVTGSLHLVGGILQAMEPEVDV